MHDFSFKNVYIDTLDDLVNNYNIAYHSTIEMKSVHAKSNTYIDSNKEYNDYNDKETKFKVSDIVRISKYKNILAKSYPPNCLKKFLWLKEFRILFRGHVINDPNGAEIVGTFYEKELKKKKKQNKNKKSLELKK